MPLAIGGNAVSTQQSFMLMLDLQHFSFKAVLSITWFAGYLTHWIIPKYIPLRHFIYKWFSNLFGIPKGQCIQCMAWKCIFICVNFLPRIKQIMDKNNHIHHCLRLLKITNVYLSLLQRGTEWCWFSCSRFLQRTSRMLSGVVEH